MEMARALAQKEGIFCGTSGGATFTGALKVAASAAAGCRILCMLPDTGERYLSTPLFEDISADMDLVEADISRSTPGYRFDSSSTPARPESSGEKKAPAAPLAIDPEAQKLVDEFLNDAGHPVVLFALEWCEFCWSIRKLFKAINLDYRSVDLDSVQYQADDLGGKIRRVLEQYTGATTIPQIFIAGQHFGGASEMFDHFRDGRLQQALEEQKIPFTHDPALDADTLLPNWLHKP
jgi:cysteine synthase A